MRVKVSICCLTYNHVDFIAKAIESFLSQRGDFEIEILIHDDASTDGTQNVIRKYEENYPDIIKPILQKDNQWTKGNTALSATFNFPRATGKYIAMCEGDDYWTDSYKLQKQIDFLEKEPNFTFVCGGFIELNVETGEQINNIKSIKKGDIIYKEGFEISFERLKTDWLTKTLTVVFKKETLNFSLIRSYMFSRDVHIFYYLLKAGKGLYYTDILGTYRIHSGGVFSGETQKNNILKHIELYKELYERNPRDHFLKYKFFNCMIIAMGRGYVSKWAYFPKAMKVASNFSDYINLIKATLNK